jgi:peptidoglycan hydrolase FlgJ
MIDAVSSTATPAPAPNDRAKLKAAAQQFEAVFLRQIISSMRSASLGDGLLDSSSSDQFREMSDARTADAMAQKGAIGIADMLLKQFGGADK